MILVDDDGITSANSYFVNSDIRQIGCDSYDACLAYLNSARRIRTTIIALPTIGLNTMPKGAVNWDDPRDRNQRLIDRLLMLYLFDRVSDVSRITGDVKLQKLVFLSENDMLEEDLGGLKYKFYRWNLGPMSKGVYEDHAYLCENELVSESQGETLSKGREVLRQSIPILQENTDIVDAIDDVVADFGTMSGAKLKNVVYDKEIILPGGEDRIAVRDIPKGQDIFNPAVINNLVTEFELTLEWAETLSIMFDADSRKSVKEALEASRNEKSRPFEPINAQG